jgi:hypothetical protein
MALVGCAAPREVPEPEQVCDLARWRQLRPAAFWSDSLVAERDLDRELVRLSSPPLPDRPPPEGWAVIGTVVTPEGLPADVAVMASSSPAVEGLSRQLVLASRFSPPRRGGVPVWAFVCIPVVMRIV